ncbi:alpha/beta fold hydrolase [Lichenihabitans sp. Uapishka_5]|uniref:alpha/beta fold hydrolase n=1 Tax=Lichenihabitans sp. Uapishka_5 TaxID=3037302 RepID=UPI0029E81EAE|nr:alpha/beta fold hydrolase [Lichenihabitans sp. Uapishka_5]MDX7950588.1 alpha/beta fold hydrolase [Lichenihabitans sp. Uapishka_5]
MLTAVAEYPAPLAQPQPQERPVSIGSLFGWLTPGHNGRGVIFCGTWGYEQHCAHRPWRELARRIAATGCTTLRFDYPGSGDSGDDTLEHEGPWTKAIRHAVRYLRAVAAVDEVVLVGLRLGGTLAVLVADDEPIDRMILLAPFATGKALIREATLQARMIDVLPDGSPMPATAGAVTAGGFALAPTVLTEIAGIDLMRRDHRPATHILLMGQDRGTLADRYRDLGATITTLPFPDLAHLCANALESRFSEATLATVAEHVARGLPSNRMPSFASRSPSEARIEGPHGFEEPVRFGPGVVGVECHPLVKPRDPVVLFLNMGLDVHSGPGRQTTQLARRLAGAGLRSLRMDLRGAGDSPDRPDGRLPLYDLAALDDVRAAVDHIATRWGGPIIVAGTCNGAYLALHAICRDHRIAGAVLVNLYCFDWDLAHGGAPYSATAARSIATYLSLAGHGPAWRRVLGGRTPVLKIIRTLMRRLRDDMRRRFAAAFTRDRRAVRLPDRIAAVRRRGAQLALLYSAGDLGLTDLHVRFGRAPARLEKTFGRPVRIVPGVDHAFNAMPAREALYETLIDVSARLS